MVYQLKLPDFDIVHFDIDSHFTSARERYMPWLKDFAFVIYNPWRGKTGTPIQAANFKAKYEYGIDSGMSFEEANKKCTLLFMVENPELQKELSQKFFTYLRGWNRELEPYGEDEAWMNFTGKLSREELIAEIEVKRSELNDKLSRQGRVTVSAGYGKNKLMAKMATNLAKSDGFLDLDYGEKWEKDVWPLKVRKLHGIGSETEQNLEEIGVKTIGDLARMPRYILTLYFGYSTGMRLHLNSWGIDYTSFKPFYSPEFDKSKSIGRTTWCGEKRIGKRIIKLPPRKAIKKLSSRVAEELQLEDRQALGVVLSARGPDYKWGSKRELADGYFDGEERILSLANILADDLFPQFDYEEKINRVGVRAFRLGARKCKQLELLPFH